MAIYFQTQSVSWPINENHPDRDAVFIGDITSTGPINLRFKNVVIMGNIRSLNGSITIEAIDNLFQFGIVKCEGRGDLCIKGTNFYARGEEDSPEETTLILNKMRSLGICFTQTSPTTFLID